MPTCVSPYEYWQYWRNTEDADVARFLKLFTVLPLPEIERLAALKDAEINEAKKILATEATALVHGRAAAEEAAATARTTFEEGGLSANLPTVNSNAILEASGLSVLGAFVLSWACVVEWRGTTSNQEWRRFKVNDTTVTDEKMLLTGKDLTADGAIKLSLGRKRHVLLKPV